MIGFIGLSHLGLISSLAAAFKTKERVVAYDPDAGLCGRLQKGDLAIFEPGLMELWREVSPQIKFVSDPSQIASCGLVYFSPDTPTDAKNVADLSTLHALMNRVAEHLDPAAALVILSQIPPGFTRQTFKNGTFGPRKIFHQVETLIFGEAIERALKPERTIVGCADPGEKLPTSYEAFLNAFGCPVFRMKYESAELAKMSINICLAATLTAANSLAEVCEKIGADWSEIVPALRADARIGQKAYLAAGLGIAGGNIERDLTAVNLLAKEWGADPGFTESMLFNSRHRKRWTLRKIREEIGPLTPETLVALWGLAYKADTRSLKNSPAIELLEDLTSCQVRAYDPQALLDKAAFPNTVQTSSALEACRGARVLLVMTPWKEFSSISLEKIRELMKGRLILDPWGILDEKACLASGFQYFRLGVAGKGASR